MNANSGLFNKAVMMRIGLFIALIVVSIGAGLYLGKLSVPTVPIAKPLQKTRMPESPSNKESGPERDQEDASQAETDVPLFLHVGGTGTEKWEIVEAQLSLASGAGIRRFIAPVTLDWTESSDAEGENPENVNTVLEKYLKVDDSARVLVWVDLNPPVAWLERHSETAIMVNGALQAYPSISSPLWLETANRLLEKLILDVESGPFGARVLGYGLTALRDQRWMLTDEFDVSQANAAGFRKWLEHTYKTEEALKAAWQNTEASFGTAAIPECPKSEETINAFWDIPAGQPLVDFNRYCSEQTAGVLSGFAALTARVSTITPMILAPYGYSYEAMSSTSGHYALELLLDSAITGLVSPVSYFDRGLGGVGGMMGAVDSLKVRGKSWYILDDTRTGVERDEETGEFARIKGLRASDVYEVQRRNFSMALTYGLGLIWSDPSREGWLNDPEQWLQFKNLKEIYAKNASASNGQEKTDSKATLTVVVDEASNFYLQDAAHTNSILLQRGRDAALRAGISTRFHLLRDVIDGISPPTPVYLFLNAFQLSEDSRARLHARFALEQAAVIWVYAPGYFGTTPDVKNISAATGMDVRAFPEPTQSGSKYILSGPYMKGGENFGTQELWSPLFYIQPSESIDFLATYTADTEKGSVAVVTLPEGWTSLYVAEPEMTPALLSTILQILEQHIYPNPEEGTFYDTFFARDPLISLHASRPGKRSLYLGRFCDVEDQLDPNIGWFGKETILMSLATGETRLLYQKE